MGTKMGLCCANLFIGFIEHQFLGQYNSSKPELYGPYIDNGSALPPLPERSSLNL